MGPSPRVVLAVPGRCALRNDGGCQPANGAARPEIIQPPDAPEIYGFLWLEYCTRQSDCGADGDRYCDMALGACMTDRGMRLQLGRLQFEGPCIPGEEEEADKAPDEEKKPEEKKPEK